MRGLVQERAARGSGPLIVSFAAETGDAHGSVMDHARAKFARKGSDVQVVNEVGRDLTFGQDETTVHVLRRGTDEVLTVGPRPRTSSPTRSGTPSHRCSADDYTHRPDRPDRPTPTPT